MSNIIENQLKRGKMLGYPKMEVSKLIFFVFFFCENGQDQVANQHLFTKNGPYNSLLYSLYIYLSHRILVWYIYLHLNSININNMWVNIPVPWIVWVL